MQSFLVQTFRCVCLSLGAGVISVALAAPLWAENRQNAEQQAEPKRERAGEIETRLIDLQVRIATLYSLNPGAGPAAAAVPLEQEMQTLNRELRGLTGAASIISAGATRGQALSRAPAPMVGAAGASSATGGAAADSWFGTTTVQPNSEVGQQGADASGSWSPGNGAAGAPPNGISDNTAGWTTPDSRPRRADAERYGEVMPPPTSLSRIGRSGSEAAPSYRQSPPSGYGVTPPPSAPPRETPTGNLAALAPSQAGPSGSSQLDSAEAAYQRAYGLLLQQDYGAAEAALTDFLKLYPGSSLAGNAQYWLGETHYARKNYRDAAVAFLEGFEKHGDGNKGADSLLKLSLSLAALGQRDAACSSLAAFATRYNSAPAPLKQRADKERRKLRCSS